MKRGHKNSIDIRHIDLGGSFQIAGPETKKRRCITEVRDHRPTCTCMAQDAQPALEERRSTLRVKQQSPCM